MSSQHDHTLSFHYPRPIYTYVLGILILFFSLFRFYHLDAGSLWQDEAEYATLAKNVATYGVPTRKYNPIPYMNTQIYDDFTLEDKLEKYEDINYLKNDLNTYYTWIPFYLMAGIYKVFGVTTQSARSFSAICGLLTALLIFQIIKEQYNQDLGFLGCYIFLSSFFIIYLNRLSVHYSAAIFFELLTMFIHWKYYTTNNKKWLYWLIVVLGLYYHTQSVFFLMSSFIVCAHHFFRRDFKSLCKIILGVSFFVAPWLYFSNFFSYSKFVPLNSYLSFENTFHNYLSLFNKQVPLGILLLTSIIYAVIGLFTRKLNSFEKYIMYWFFSLVFFIPIFAPWWLTSERSASLLLPLSILAVVSFNRIFKDSRFIKLKHLGLLVFLAIPLIYVDWNLKSTLDKTIRAIVVKEFDYGANWTRDAIKFIEQNNIKKTDLVLSTMDNMTLNFYTQLNVHFAWAVNPDYLEKNYRQFWFFEAPDLSSCKETTYLMKDKGESICGLNSYFFKKLPTCKKYERKNYNIYFCQNT